MTNPDELKVVSGHIVEIPQAPSRIEFMPWGEFEVNGDRYRYTDESVRLVQAHVASRKVDIVIDYDHGTSTNPPASGIAPAAGWIKRNTIDIQSGRPLASAAEWTPAAARAIQNKEFRYLSPTFLARPDGLVVGLKSVGLTNTPAIDLKPISAHTKPADAAGERTDAMKKVAETLGLAAEATEEQIVTKVKELQVSASEAGPLREAIAGLAGELGDETLKGQAATEKVEVVSASVKTLALKAKNPAGMVAAGDYDALKVRLGQVESDLRTRDCNALISAHERKLPPAKHEWFRKFYAQDAKAAEEWLKEAPELVSGSSAGQTGSKPAPQGGDRNAIIVSARAARRADLAAGKYLVGSERSYVHGELRAAGQPGVTDEEAKALALN